MQLSKLFVALLASSSLLLTACGGSSSSGSSDTVNSGDSGSSDSGSGDSGSGTGTTAQASWSTPTELEDGSVTVSGLMVGGSANKPMMAYSKSGLLYIREFDGSNWSSAHQLAAYDGTHDISWAFNANGKAVLALENNATNSATGFTECRLDYYRYNGTQWGDYSRARHLINSSNNYTCHNVDDLKIALSDDDSVALIWNRSDLTSNKGRVQGCDSTDTCVTDATSSPQTLGSDYNAVALGMGNAGEGYILKMETSKFGTSKSGVFATSFSDGNIGSSANIGDYPGNSRLARIAVNDANHALALFNANNTLQARFDNGSGFATSVELDDDLAGANYDATLEAYLSAGADYGLSLWVNNWTDLKTNISDAGSFAGTTVHPQNNDVIRSVTGAINDNGKAVIVWLGYDADAVTQTLSNGTIYSRFYDGSSWQDVETIDSDIDVASFLSVKGGLGVYLDNSDDVTLVYNAYKASQSTTEPKTFYTRRTID